MSQTLTPIRQDQLLAGLCALLALTLLWLNHRHVLDLDLTANARHSLTKLSITKVMALQGAPLEVLAVIGPNQTQRDAVETLIDRYRQYKADITLSFVNPEIEPDRARELDAAPGGELFLRFSGREARLQNVSERTLTQAMHRLSAGGQRDVGFVTGHGERNIHRQTNDDYAYVAQTLQNGGFRAMPISLVSVPRVPDNIEVLVIAAPQQPFFPGEVAAVLDYVSRGGNLLWLIDSADYAGLRALALELGIDLIDGQVIDTNSQAWGAESPTFAVIDQYPQHPINDGLQLPVLLPQARALSITPLAGQNVAPLLLTGSNSWTELGPVSGAVSFDESTGETRGPLVLAAAVERQRSKGTQRVVVVGDADLFASTWIGNGANREYISRINGWLAGADEDLVFTTPRAADSEVHLTRRQTLVIGVGFLIVLPVLFLLVAVYFWQMQQRGRH